MYAQSEPSFLASFTFVSIPCISYIPRAPSHFRFLTGSLDDSSLGTYQFNTKRGFHCFCNVCGSNIFAYSNQTMVVSARMLDRFDVDKVTEVMRVDGRKR